MKLDTRWTAFGASEEKVVRARRSTAETAKGEALERGAKDMRVIGISGSLRKNSYNTALLRAATELAPPELEIEIRPIREIPLYNADVEAQGTPQAVEELKQAIREADGLLIATPEYNHSMPGVLKNTIDWLSRRGVDDKPMVFPGLPIGLMGASASGLGTALSQAAWLEVFRVMGGEVLAGAPLAIPRAMTVFEEDGQLTDKKTKERLERFLTQYVAFLARVRKMAAS